MRFSRYFLPTLKENPSEAQIVSHRLMLRAGMVRQSSAGIYSWLPMGFRVLKNIERIVREEQDAMGNQEVLMPTILPADLWRQSERYDDYGPEMLRIKDRHDHGAALDEPHDLFLFCALWRRHHHGRGGEALTRHLEFSDLSAACIDRAAPLGVSPARLRRIAAQAHRSKPWHAAAALLAS